MGLPLPATPLLLAAGALAGAGQLSVALAIAVPVLASVLADGTWYQIGRLRGGRVLNTLCRISLEPDSCVRRTENAFVRQGARSLLIAKFVPGLNTMAPPLAGIIGMSWWRFLVYDALGALVYVGTFIVLGFMFSDQLEQVADRVSGFGASIMAIVVAGLLFYIGWKYIQRRRFIRSLRIARITPEELKQRLDAGEDIVVVDLRHSLELEGDPPTIPGAIRLSAEKLDESPDKIPRDREIVLFCT
jgi:membrane protein DedA with SNARE-associated domain